MPFPHLFVRLRKRLDALEGKVAVDPGVVLKEAREACQRKDYPAALEKYQCFYHNAVEIKPSCYGVRLSYCLAEWKALGGHHAPAMQALIDLKEQVLSRFNESLSYADFHEYSSIARELGDDDEVYERFLYVQEEAPELAGKIFSFVYDYCARNGMWDICCNYLGSGDRYYKRVIERFDAVLAVANKKGGVQRLAIIESEIEYFKKEVVRLLEMLKACGGKSDYASLLASAEGDLAHRGYKIFI